MKTFTWQILLEGVKKGKKLKQQFMPIIKEKNGERLGNVSLALTGLHLAPHYGILVNTTLTLPTKVWMTWENL